MSIYYAGVEAGGTSFKLAIAAGPDFSNIETTSFETKDREETLKNVVNWLKERQSKFVALGIASFGPVDLDPASLFYGYITSTPKDGWQDTPLLKTFEQFNVPMGFDTDVNAPALSEVRIGGHEEGGRTIESCAYITVGTGVGVGLVVRRNTPVHGLVHPEAGHMRVPRHKHDVFPGNCPRHKDCVEGMVSSGALAARLGVAEDKLPTISNDDKVWKVIGHYLAALCVNLVLTVSPSVIVLGGGVMNRDCLYAIVREKTLKLLNGYIVSDMLTPGKIDKYIVRSRFGNDSGIVGALELARLAYENKPNA